MMNKLFKNLSKKLFASEKYWNIYLNLYDNMMEFPPYRKMLEDVYNTLELDRYIEGTFLDAACGTGNFITFSLLKNPNLRFYCFDASKRGLEITRRKSEELLSLNEIENKVSLTYLFFKDRLPYDDNYFDGISAINFIQYLDKYSLENFIKECKRILKPNGKIVLVYSSNKVNFKDGVEGYKKMLAESSSVKKIIKNTLILLSIGILNFPMKFGMNIYIYPKEYIEELLKNHGFVDVKSYHTYYSGIATLTSGRLLK